MKTPDFNTLDIDGCEIKELKDNKIFYYQYIWKIFSFTFTPFDWGVGFTFGYTDHWGVGLFVGPFYLSIDMA